jgi:hypothetical protein
MVLEQYIAYLWGKQPLVRDVLLAFRVGENDLQRAVRNTIISFAHSLINEFRYHAEIGEHCVVYVADQDGNIARVEPAVFCNAAVDFEEGELWVEPVDGPAFKVLGIAWCFPTAPATAPASDSNPTAAAVKPPKRPHTGGRKPHEVWGLIQPDIFQWLDIHGTPAGQSDWARLRDFVKDLTDKHNEEKIHPKTFDRHLKSIVKEYSDGISSGKITRSPY